MSAVVLREDCSLLPNPIDYGPNYTVNYNITTNNYTTNNYYYGEATEEKTPQQPEERAFRFGLPEIGVWLLVMISAVVLYFRFIDLFMLT